MRPLLDLLQPSDVRRQVLFFSATAVVTVSAMAFFLTREDADQKTSTEPLTAAHQPSEVFGPGTLVPSGTASWRTPPQFPDPEQQLGVDERQRLLVNIALLDAFNHYLVEQAGEHDADDLKAYLKEKLPQDAYAQALQIIDRYQAYMQAHDEFLTAQNLQKIDANPTLQSLAATDIKHIADWITQRDRLRQNFLGEEINQAWYQNDNSSLNQALDELQQRIKSATPALGTDTQPAMPVPHWNDKKEEEQHVQYLFGLLRNATTSFSSLKPTSYAVTNRALPTD